MIDVLGQLAAILVVSFFMKELGDRINFPFIVLLILTGTLMATYGIIEIKNLEPFPEMIRTLALILAVYSSAFYLNISEVKKHTKSIIMLSTIGVALTALIVSWTTYYLLPIPIIAAAFLGAFLSGTDPAAIAQALPKKASELAEVIRAESLFNSPFTVILPLILLDFVTFPENAIFNIPKVALLVIIGTATGIILGTIGKTVLEKSKGNHTQTLGLAIVIATYVITEQFLGSGILAVALCSIVIKTGKYKEKEFLGEFNSELAFISTLFVFMLLGAQFKIEQLTFNRFEIIAIIIALIIARLITSAVVLFNSEFSLKDKIKIGFIGPKGVAPAALAPLLLAHPDKIIGADLILKITYAAIIVSILVSLVAAKLSLKEEENPKEKVQDAVKKMKIVRLDKKTSIITSSEGKK